MSFTKLHAAAQCCDLDEIVLLIQHGVDVDATTNEDVTPLHIASGEGHYDAVDQLLAMEANPVPVANDGKTPKEWAAQRGHTEIVELLKGK